MAAPNRIFSLDLGTQTVGIAEFHTGKTGGLVLANYRSTGLLADPAADASRLAQARIATSEMVGASGLKGQKVNYSISAQSVFTRFVKLPAVGEDQAEQIVAFEAQQNVPFPIDEVVWDYQLVDTGTPEVEVVLVAIKSDLLDEINGAVEDSGLRANTVDVSPMALYNAFRYNYSDQDGCALLIDIGARTTNLIFVEPKKVFSRSIAIGGSKITEAIAKDFNEPFGAAEERKKQDGFVSLGGAYSDPDDPEIARVSKMIRNSMTRLHAEISRSISFYRSQQHGSQPVRVFLCGGSATLPYMREFFHEKLQLPVEFFNPLRNVAIGPNLNVDEIGRQAHTLGEVVGLALRNIGSCPMELNLRPVSLVKRQRMARQKPFIILAGLCFLMILAAWWVYFDHAAAIANEEVAKVEERLAPLQSMDGKMKAVQDAKKKQEALAAPLLAAVSDRGYWTEIINDINSRLPEDYIWIVSLGLQETKPNASTSSSAKNAPAKDPRPVLLLQGLYLENPKNAQIVVDFIEKLKASPLYEVREDEMRRANPNDTEWAFDYSVPLVLKTSISH
ncbi:MAG: Type pilus assembly protein PilM [Chthoniobacteraceae bacterium]|nr:Type pilus assembly protein PilM [Chthoniobacteraceae bacterium]